MGSIGYPETSEITNLCCVKPPEESRSQNMSNFSVSFHQDSAKWSNIYVFCDIISNKTLYRRVNSHDLPGQGMGPAFPTQYLCSRSKSPFIPKIHQTWEFQPLIPQKQNPHTEINQLPVTAKIFSQPSIQLCVASVAVHSWQTDCHGLHKRLPWLVQHSGLIWTLIILMIHQRLKKYSSYIMVQ